MFGCRKIFLFFLLVFILFSVRSSAAPLLLSTSSGLLGRTISFHVLLALLNLAAIILLYVWYSSSKSVFHSEADVNITATSAFSSRFLYRVGLVVDLHAVAEAQ